MKNTRFGLCSLMFVALLLFTNKLSIAQKNAGEYMHSITDHFDNISSDMWDYTCSVGHGKSARKVDNKRKELIQTVAQAKQKIKSLPSFNGDNSLRDSIVNLLDINYKVLTQDFAKIVDMEAISEQSYDGMEAYMLAQEQANDKLQLAGASAVEQQRKFAKANGINLVESNDKISQKLEISDKIYGYYNPLYLIFFKSYKQEAYLLDAINKLDVNGVEQNRNALIETSKEGLAKLAEVKAFNGDNSIVLAAREMLKFYQLEATEKVPEMVKFIIVKEKFDKIEKAFNSKPESKRTNEDREQYNAGVKEINAVSTKYNSVNGECNQKRTQYQEKWNNSVTVFLDRHMPKKK